MMGDHPILVKDSIKYIQACRAHSDINYIVKKLSQKSTLDDMKSTS